MQNLILVLGDQLDLDSAAFDGFDPEQDAVWMAEVAHESTKVWSTTPRIAVFLAAMRHFRDALRERGWKVFYRELTADGAVWRNADGRAKPAKGDTFADNQAWDRVVKSDVKYRFVIDMATLKTEKPAA